MFEEDLRCNLSDIISHPIITKLILRHKNYIISGTKIEPTDLPLTGQHLYMTDLKVIG